MTDKLFGYFYNKGLENSKDNDITGAIRALIKAISIKGNDTTGWNLLGLCYYRLGDLATAEYCWAASLQINGEAENEAINYLECVKNEIEFVKENIIPVKDLLIQKKYKKALKVFENKVLWKKIKKDDSSNNSESSVNFLAKEHAIFLNYAGLLYMLNKKRKKALILWKKAIRLDKSNSEALKYILEITNPY